MRGRPIALARAFQGVMEAVRVEQVDAQHVFPIGDPLHALHGGIHEDAAKRLAQQARAAQLVRGRAADFHRHVLVGPVARADDRVEVVHADHVHVRVMLEEIAFHADQAAQPLFI